MSKFKVGDKVKLISGLTLESTGIQYDNLIEMNKGVLTIEKIETNKKDETLIFINDGWCFEEDQLVKVEDNMNQVNNNTILWAKVKEGATIPTKRTEDAGYDIYACFDEDYIIIEPHTTKLIPTGLASACSDDYVFVLRERGSNGSKGIAQRCGVIDSGYRNEWFVPLTNTNDIEVIIAKEGKDIPVKRYLNLEPTKTSIIYPYEKGIAQTLLLPVPKVTSKEITYEELQNIKSERGLGALGSSGK